MEVNKDEARRCIELAEAALKSGNVAKAEKLLRKSQNLFPLKEAEVLLARLKQRTAGGGTGGTRAADGGASTARQRRTGHAEAKATSEPRLNVDYTQEQLDAVKRIQKCKDFYEVLGVTQEVPDSDIKKAYKKLALQLHPDKNKAPGAMEAFKALGNAVATLTDAQKRKAYDLYRTTGDGLSSPRHSSYDHGSDGFTFQRGFDSEMNPNDLFNMFFGSGFAQQQQHHHHHQQQQHFHHQRARNRWHSSYGDNSGSQPSLIFGLILCFIVVSMLSTFFVSDPLYSLHKTNKYAIERRTLNLKIPYFVKGNFLNEYQGSLGRLENSVEEEYVTYMRRACSNERTYRDAMMARAKNFGSRSQFEQAQSLKLPSCDALYRLGIGHVLY